MSEQPPAAGNELAELLWENGLALRRTAVPFFPPFACTIAGTASSRAQELAKQRGPAASAMRDLLAVQEEAVPWLHCPIVDGDDDVPAPLPPKYCSGLLAGYSDDLQAPAAVASTSRGAGGAVSTSHGAVVVPPAPELSVPKQQQQQQPRPSGEGVMNFTFFSRPLQRPPGCATASNTVESTVVQTATNLLRSTPLFSEQRMAWLQPPKESRITTTVAAPPPPPAHSVPIRLGEAAAAFSELFSEQRMAWLQPPKESRITTTVAAPPPPPAHSVPIRLVEAAAALAQRPQPEARPPQPPPPPATATTSSVCSDNGDRSQLKRSSHHHYHQPTEWSGSQDEVDLDDDDAGALRRSAGRSTKRGRTAEVHNMSERRRRDRINEKMRALQELIPNCNKIDKASMLEEAIEYLKTLQLQVQMMSMGTGMCMPSPMMHLQMPSPMAHFHHHHHLGAMGALSGFGMAAGAFDPRAAAAQFTCPMIPGAPMFGVPPPSFPPHMATVAMNNNAAAAAQAEQAPSDDHPQQAPAAVPRAL